MVTFHPDRKCVTADNVLGGVSISDNTNRYLHSLLYDSWQALLMGSPVEGTHILSEGIFMLNCQPDVIFKISKDVLDRWENVKTGVAFCKKRQLGLLVIPRQTLLKLFIQNAPHFVIAEHRLPLSHDFCLQGDLYQSLGDKLNPALEQLVIFIIEVGFKDVDFRNIPILDKSLENETKPRIALVDLENCAGKHERRPREFFDLAYSGNGRWGIRGLFRCITPSNFRTVRSATENEGVDLEKMFGEGYYSQALNNRAVELELYNKHRKISATSETYDEFIRGLVDSLGDFGIHSTESEIDSSPLSRDKQYALGHAPRFFKTSVTVSNVRSTMSGVIVLDANSSLLALGILVEGAGFSADKELLEKRFEEYFDVDTEKTSLFTETSLFSFTVLLSSSSDDLGMFYSLRFPDLRRVFPTMD